MLLRTLSRQAWRISSHRSTTSSIAISNSNNILLKPHPPSSLHSYPTQVSRALSTTQFLSHPSTPMAAETDTQAEAIQSSTGITPETLTSTLQNASTLNPVHVDIQDISGGCGASFAALIVSDAFQGKSALQRHRLVNGLLKDEIKAIHAWTPRCLTREQWEKEKEKGNVG